VEQDTSEATRSERHRESDELQQRRCSKEKDGETGDDKYRQHDCAERGKRRRTTAVEIAVQAVSVMTAAMAV
jgi:hypothetical protein